MSSKDLIDSKINQVLEKTIKNVKLTSRSRFLIVVLVTSFILFWIGLNIVIPIIQLKTMQETKYNMKNLKLKHSLDEDLEFLKMKNNFETLKKVTTVSAILYLLFGCLGFFTFENKLRR